LVVADNADNAVSVLLGNGDGTFVLQPSIPLAETPFRVVIRDLNRDGKLDIAVAVRNSSNVTVFLGNGDGHSPASPVRHWGGSQSLIAADLNGDGKPDLVTANEDAGSITILLNTSGTAAKPSITFISPTSANQGTTIPNFTVNGSNFDPAAVLSFGGTGITVNSYSSRAATQIVANITIGSTALTGAYDVIVANPDSQRQY